MAAKTQDIDLNPTDFYNAIFNNDEKGLRPYRDYAKAAAAKLLKKDIPDREMIVEDVADHAILELYNNLGNYNPALGLSFSSYLYNRVRFSLTEMKAAHGIRKQSPEYFDGDSGYHVPSDPDERADEGHPEKFRQELIPYIREFADRLPAIKKRILMAKWGYAIDPVNYPTYTGSGYATQLSAALAQQGIHKTPEAIKTMLWDILKHLRDYLADATGMSDSEIHDNLTQFIVVDSEKKDAIKEEVRTLLRNLDVSSMSDDDAAWLFSEMVSQFNEQRR